MSIGRELAYALDAPTFAVEALHLAPDRWQAAALRSTATRALWLCSRQSGKSTTASVLALHRALYRPGSLVLAVSPSLRQSAELYRKIRDLARSLVQLPAMTEDTATSATFANGSRVISLPSSEATIRGYSAVDLLLFDEAARVDDSLYRATRPMVAVSGGAIVAMSTPFGRRGWFYEAFEHGGENWERTKVTAAECSRISPQFLEEERQALGSWWFEQEYDCTFIDAADAVFRADDVAAAFDESIEPLFGRSA